MADRELTLGVVFTGRVDSSFMAAVSKLKSEISGVVGGQEKQTAATKKATVVARESGKAHRWVGKQISGVHGTIERLYAAMKVTAAYSVAATALFGVVNAARAAVSEIVEYDQALKNLQAIVGATNAEVSSMADAMKNVARETKFSTKEIAEAMVTLGQAGFTAEESVAAIDAVARLATGTLTDLGTVSDLMTSSIRAFGLDASDAGKIADVMASAINKSKLTVDKLRIALGYVGPVANKAGVSIEETAAAAGVLANSGLRASTIGTGLRQMLARLIAPTDKLRAAFNAAGADMSKLDPRFNSLSNIIGELSKVVPTARRAFELFGLRAASSVAALTEAGTEGFNKMLDEIYKVGTAQAMAEKQMEGLAVMAKNLKDRLGLLAIAVGEGGLASAFRLLLTAIRPVVTALTYLVGNPIGQFMVALTGLSVTIAGLTLAMKVAAVQFAALALGIQASAVTAGKAAGAIGLLKVAMAGLTATAKRLWALFTVTPLGRIVGVLALVGTAIYTLQKYYSGLTEEIEKNIIALDKDVGSLEDYRRKLSQMDEGSREYSSAMQRLVNDYEELKEVVDDTTWTFTDQGKALDKLLERKRLDRLGEMVILMREMDAASKRTLRTIGTLGSVAEKGMKTFWDLFLPHPQATATLLSWGRMIENLLPDEFMSRLRKSWTTALSVYQGYLGDLADYFEDLGAQTDKGIEISKKRIEDQKRFARDIGEYLKNFGLDYASSVEEIQATLGRAFKGTEEDLKSYSVAIKAHYTEQQTAVLKTSNIVARMTNGWIQLYQEVEKGQKKNVEKLYLEYQQRLSLIEKEKRARTAAGISAIDAERERLAKEESLKEQYEGKIQARFNREVNLKKKTTQEMIEATEKEIANIEKKYKEALEERNKLYEKDLENAKKGLVSKTEVELEHHRKIRELHEARVTDLVAIEESRILSLKNQYSKELELIESYHQKVLSANKHNHGIIQSDLEFSLTKRIDALENSQEDESDILSQRANIYSAHYEEVMRENDRFLGEMITATEEAYQQRMFKVKMEHPRDIEKQNEKIATLQEQLNGELDSLNEQRLVSYRKTINALISEERRLAQQVKHYEEEKRQIRMDAEDILREIGYKGLEDEEKLNQQLLDADSYYFNAREELLYGNLEHSKEFAKKAQDLYATVARAAEDGSVLEVKAVSGIRDATDLLIESTEKMQVSVETAMIQIGADISSASERAADLGVQMSSVSGQEIEIRFEKFMVAVEAAMNKIAALTEETDKLDGKEVKVGFGDAVREAEKAEEKARGVATVINEIDGTRVTYTIEENLIRKREGLSAQEISEELQRDVELRAHMKVTAEDGQGLGDFQTVAERVKKTILRIQEEVEEGSEDTATAVSRVFAQQEGAFGDFREVLETYGAGFTSSVEKVTEGLSAITGVAQDQLTAVAEAAMKYNKELSATSTDTEAELVSLSANVVEYYDQVSEESKKAIINLQREYDATIRTLADKAEVWAKEYKSKEVAMDLFNLKRMRAEEELLSKAKAVASEEIGIVDESSRAILEVINRRQEEVEKRYGQQSKVLKDQYDQSLQIHIGSEEQKAAVSKEFVDKRLDLEKESIIQITELERTKNVVRAEVQSEAAKIEEAFNALRVSSYYDANISMEKQLKESLDYRMEQLKNSEKSKTEIISSTASAYADHYYKVERLQSGFLESLVTKLKAAFDKGKEAIIGQADSMEEENRKMLELQETHSTALSTIYQLRADDFRSNMRSMIGEAEKVLVEVRRIEEEKIRVATETSRITSDLAKLVAEADVDIRTEKLAHNIHYYEALKALSEGDLSRARQHTERVIKYYEEEATVADASSQRQVDSLVKLQDANELLARVIEALGKVAIREFDEITMSIGSAVSRMEMLSEDVEAFTGKKIEIDTLEVVNDLERVRDKLRGIQEEADKVNKLNLKLDTSSFDRSVKQAIDQVETLIHRLKVDLPERVYIDIIERVHRDPRLDDLKTRNEVVYEAKLIASPPMPFTQGIERMKESILSVGESFNALFRDIEFGARAGDVFRDYIEEAKKGHIQVLSDLEKRLAAEERMIAESGLTEAQTAHTRTLLYSRMYADMFNENASFLKKMEDANSQSYIDQLAQQDVFYAEQVAKTLSLSDADEEVRRREALVWKARLSTHQSSLNEMLFQENELYRSMAEITRLKDKLLAGRGVETIKTESTLTKDIELQNRIRLEAEESYYTARDALRSGDLTKALHHGESSVDAWLSIAQAAERGSSKEKLAIEGIAKTREMLTFVLSTLESQNEMMMDSVTGEISRVQQSVDSLQTVFDEISRGLDLEIDVDPAVSSLETIQGHMRNLLTFWSDGKKTLEDMGAMEMAGGFQAPAQTTPTSPLTRTFDIGNLGSQLKNTFEDIAAALRRQTYFQKTDEGLRISPPDVSMQIQYEKQDEMVRLLSLLVEIESKRPAGSVNISGYQGDARKLAFELKRLQGLGAIPSLG